MKADRLSRFLAMRSVSSSRFIEVMCLVIQDTQGLGHSSPNKPNKHDNRGRDKFPKDKGAYRVIFSFDHRPQLVTDPAPSDEALLRLNLEDALEALAV